MATYTVNIDEKNTDGKKFLEFMKTLPYISVSKNKNTVVKTETVSNTKKISGLREALKDVEEGRVFDIPDWKAYTQQLIDGKNDQI